MRDLYHIHTAEGFERKYDLVLDFENTLRVPSFPKENEREPLKKILERVCNPKSRPRSGFLISVDREDGTICGGAIYGYTVKSRRIAATLPKTSESDAFCIAGNMDAQRLNTITRLRRLRRHNRQVMKANKLSGGRWKHNQAPREVKGFRQYDTVLYNHSLAYIHARRSSGFFVVKDAEGRTVSNSVSYKKLTLIRHCNAHLAFSMPAGPV